MRIERVAVIGSGISGMRAAQLLAESGHKVTVFEKSGGTGGRLASGRLGQSSVDLGAQMIAAGSTGFEGWLGRQGAQPWQPRCSTFQLDELSGRNGWVAVPRSSALTRGMADGVELRTDTRVAVVWPDRQGVLLRDTGGEALGYFDAVVVAVPAPQAATLLDAIHRFRQRAESTLTFPVWTLQLSLACCPARLASSDWLEGEHPVLQRIVRDSSKPRRGGENWVIQAGEAWSRRHVETDPAQVMTALLAAFIDIAGEAVQPLHYRVHRWLYARAEPNAGQERALWDPQNCIGACGDWLYGGDIEGAWMSANELVAKMVSPGSKVA